MSKTFRRSVNNRGSFRGRKFEKEEFWDDSPTHDIDTISGISLSSSNPDFDDVDLDSESENNKNDSNLDKKQSSKVSKTVKVLIDGQEKKTMDKTGKRPRSKQKEGAFSSAHGSRERDASAKQKPHSESAQKKEDSSEMSKSLNPKGQSMASKSKRSEASRLTENDDNVRDGASSVADKSDTATKKSRRSSRPQDKQMGVKDRVKSIEMYSKPCPPPASGSGTSLMDEDVDAGNRNHSKRDGLNVDSKMRKEKKDDLRQQRRKLPETPSEKTMKKSSSDDINIANNSQDSFAPGHHPHHPSETPDGERVEKSHKETKSKDNQKKKAGTNGKTKEEEEEEEVEALTRHYEWGQAMVKELRGQILPSDSSSFVSEAVSSVNDLELRYNPDQDICLSPHRHRQKQQQQQHQYQQNQKHYLQPNPHRRPRSASRNSNYSDSNLSLNIDLDIKGPAIPNYRQQNQHPQQQHQQQHQQQEQKHGGVSYLYHDPEAAERLRKKPKKKNFGQSVKKTTEGLATVSQTVLDFVSRKEKPSQLAQETPWLVTDKGASKADLMAKYKFFCE